MTKHYCEHSFTYDSLTEVEKAFVREFISNGCGPEDWKRNWLTRRLLKPVLESPKRFNWLESCHEHDFDAWRGGTFIQKLESDARFYARNHKIAKGFLQKTANFFAMGALVALGTNHFEYRERPKTRADLKLEITNYAR